MKRLLAMMEKGIVTLWEDYLIFLRVVLYSVVIIFLILGVVIVFSDVPVLGIILIVLNALLLFLFRKLDKAADADFDRDFQEMVRQNLEDQNLNVGEQKQ